MHPDRLKAAESGQSTYVGRPCPKCGNSVRYVTYDQCKSCTNKRSLANQKRRAQKIRDLLAQARGA